MTISSDPKIKVAFCVSGEFDPDELTRILSIAPTEVRRRGERTPLGRTQVRTTSWCFEEVRYGDLCIEDSVNAMLDVLWRRRDDISIFCAEWAVSLVLVVTISFYQEKPACSLGPSTMRRISDLGATFGLDIYDLS
jgi:hypothetical protein